MKRFIVTSLLVAACVVPAPPRFDAEAAAGERFSALAVLPAGAGRRMVGAGRTANVDIYISAYTNDEDTKRYAALLLDSGPESLLKAIQKADTLGRVSLTGRVGQFELKLVRSHPTGNGRRIIAVSDRPIGFLEAYNSGRSMDYTFGILQLDLESNGNDEEGAGVLIYAAKVKVLEGNKIEIENYGVDPVRLQGVRRL
jgi:hypothetical protein